ncbi:MAG: hypothetical protein I3270_01550 [Candidatus Moeniiplasma glomeromycotorum]|nr:hypothetical protein [Candidatus Moeniiplasma glomeromycotorum]MCE8162392.1 hypothetical protein [Candidatus Moeniiplasma glomeromycotorum]MCE8166317.1 hypothetical protein [Candidatus Moeniiplasma glomeromycotorum]MCE8166799.1 hypothetical protein [Candidatus Moeniiplasma glomeromycotorum]
MILIPFEYLKKYLFLPSLSPLEIAENLTYFGLETQLVEKNNRFYLEVNPLPNRVDLFCWWGIVQEIKILLNCSEKPFNLASLKPSKKNLFSVSINTKNCLTFNLALIRNIKIKASPVWLKEWLAVNQIPTVNNLVDSVNLIRLETGQNLQIYDYDNLAKKNRIVVEEAKQKQTIKLLSGQELVLNSKDLVVRADQEIISLAGISETEKTGCIGQTKNILVEASSFEPLQIKKTVRCLNLLLSISPFFFSTETLPKFTSLLVETQEQKNNLDSEIIFAYQKSSKPSLIRVSQSFLEKKIGQVLPTQQIEAIWDRLSFFYSKKGRVYSVKIPPYRLDLKEPEDLLEELLRIYGYDQVISSKFL